MTRSCSGCSCDLERPLDCLGAPTCLCPECSAEQYERLAARIDGSYDRTKVQEWATCSAILARLYGVHWEDRQATWAKGW